MHSVIIPKAYIKSNDEVGSQRSVSCN